MAASATNAAPAGPEPVLDVERVDCYRVALEFQEIAAGLLAKRSGALRDHSIARRSRSC